jgi:hypothetical protein
MSTKDIPMEDFQPMRSMRAVAETREAKGRRALQLAANFMANGFDSREALTLRKALEDAGYPIPTLEEWRVMHGLADLDGVDWS